MQQEDTERETFLTEDTGTTIMTSSWKQQLVQIFLILVSCGHVNTKTASPTPTPLSVIPPLNRTTKSAILKDENLTVTVELTHPVIMTLNCTWTGNQNKVKSNITGHWEKNGQILVSPVTVDLENDQYNLLKMFPVATEENLGNYSCVFGNEARVDFTLTVPQMDNKRDKPVVGYVRDFLSITCKMEDKPKPSTFHWFKSNGTSKEQILDDAASERYMITNVNYTTKLTVKNLSLADSGWYYCSAVYPIGTSMSKVELKVITFMEPLKPFIAILVEVVVLVILILLYEKMRAKKNTEGTRTIADQKNTEPQEDDKGAEGRTSVRQRKS